jgi:protein TonB
VRPLGGTPRLVPIAATHLPPPYPDDAKRLGDEGTTQMQVTISSAGEITDCAVVQSAGSQRLDAAACAYVQRHWKWQPLQPGQPAPASTKVSVIWNLGSGVGR